MAERTDTERLDWLEEQQKGTGDNYAWPVYAEDHWWLYHDDDSRDVVKPDLREAIDAAMDTDPTS